jgi:hypothetical protein
MRLCYEDDAIWGLDLMEDIIVTSVIPFSQPVEKNNMKDTFVYKKFSLHVLLAGDNELLHTVCGLQSCLATNFCIHCESNLDHLRKQRDITSGKIRTRATAIIQLEN